MGSDWVVARSSYVKKKGQAGMFSVLLKMKLWIGGRILALDGAIQIVRVFWIIFHWPR